MKSGNQFMLWWLQEKRKILHQLAQEKQMKKETDETSP